VGNLFIKAVSWTAKNLISFVLILGILVFGNFLYSEFQKAKAALGNLAALQASRPVLGNSLIDASKKIEIELSQAVRGGLVKPAASVLESMLDTRVVEEKAIKSRSVFGTIPSSTDFQRLIVLRMEIEAIKQGQIRVQSLNSIVSDIRDLNAQWIELGIQHRDLLVQWGIVEGKKKKLQDDPMVVTFLSADYKRLEKENDSNRKRADELRGLIENLKLSVDLKTRKRESAIRDFNANLINVQSHLNEADQYVKSEVTRLESSFFGSIVKDLGNKVGAQVLLATSILLTAILLPIGIKLFFFYLVAPRASRRPPIQVLEGTVTGSTPTLSHSSEVSMAMEISPHQELLVNADYIQSASTKTNKTTKWFLDAGFPFTSIASGLIALTRFAPQIDDTVVVSSGKHPEMKISLLELSEGATVVLQPRSLVGIRQDRQRPLKVTSHWRIRNTNSWLTLQFRYLVFHGPASLILKGCRGVRLERAGDGRLINQAATLGFSANAHYSVHRCETFVSYWRGSDELFNDQFAGSNCVYIYEEMPSLHRKGGIAGRGLEGLTDSVLKIFGI
jgi:hypothetical protein